MNTSLHLLHLYQRQHLNSVYTLVHQHSHIFIYLMCIILDINATVCISAAQQLLHVYFKYILLWIFEVSEMSNFHIDAAVFLIDH